MSRIFSRSAKVVAALSATSLALLIPATATADDGTGTDGLEQSLDMGSQFLDIADDNSEGGLTGSIEQLGLPPQVAEGLNVTGRFLQGERNFADVIDFLDVNGSLAPSQNCPAVQSDGGRGHFTKWVDIGTAGPATFHLRYQTFQIPDTIDVFYQGQNIYHDGPVGTNGDVHRDIAVPPGSDTRVKVVVYAPEAGTAWNYSVDCAA